MQAHTADAFVKSLNSDTHAAVIRQNVKALDALRIVTPAQLEAIFGKFESDGENHD